jgi:RNA polymerase sigma factor (sigma-70 family)
MDDHELLRRYAEVNSEDAFRQLVQRHGGLVYSVAMRQLRRPHQAEEVTHAVFVALSRKARALPVGTILAGWLFRSTRFAAAKLQRDEERRQRHEQEAAMMMDSGAGSDTEMNWEQIVPVLDDELAGLSEKERGAVLLRFFQNRSFKDVGEELGTSEDAAKMRVSRALDKLRQRFLKRGVVLSATALAAVFGSQASAATAVLPSVLAASVTRAAVSKSVSVALAQAILRKLAWWKWKPIVVSASVVLITGSIALFLLRGRNPAPTTPAAAPAWPPRR